MPCLPDRSLSHGVRVNRSPTIQRLMTDLRRDSKDFPTVQLNQGEVFLTPYARFTYPLSNANFRPNHEYLLFLFKLFMPTVDFCIKHKRTKRYRGPFVVFVAVLRVLKSGTVPVKETVNPSWSIKRTISLSKTATVGAVPSPAFGTSSMNCFWQVLPLLPKNLRTPI